ncbi:MAG: hypothetical protein IV085_06640 [Thiobacillus sp.]|nr:hypothetical protein [Thiobacillus sp.]
MDNLGLLLKFKVNRPLTEEEQAYQLKQDKRLNVEPLNQLSTIRMNSTYLEMVDKYYGWKGYLTLGAFVVISVLGIANLSFLLLSINQFNTYDNHEKIEDLLFLAVIFLMSLPLILVGVWMFLKETFAYTHYPIRLNRKNGKIYVFRLDGTVLAMPWKDVFFTVGKGRPRGSYDDIRGHVLDADGVTVKETFALSYSGDLSKEELNAYPDDVQETHYLFRYWEFVRRYMEEGPVNLLDHVDVVMPVAHRREGVWNSFLRLNTGWHNLWLIALPFTLLIWPFRVFAMRTSKIPQWPQWVEDECQVDPNDPYQRDEQHPQPASA